jgi:hypothetical protein
VLTPPPPQETTLILTFTYSTQLLQTSLKLPVVMTGRGVILVLIAALIVEVLFCRWLARRNWRPASTGITIAAGIASVVGPACALLPYTDYLPLFLKDLGGVWLLAAIGAIGVGIGVFALNKGSKVAGTVCLLTSIPVFAYWGFIAVFVSIGGGS